MLYNLFWQTWNQMLICNFASTLHPTTTTTTTSTVGLNEIPSHHNFTFPYWHFLTDSKTLRRALFETGLCAYKFQIFSVFFSKSFWLVDNESQSNLKRFILMISVIKKCFIGRYFSIEIYFWKSSSKLAKRLLK